MISEWAQTISSDGAKLTSAILRRSKQVGRAKVAESQNRLVQNESVHEFTEGHRALPITGWEQPGTGQALTAINGTELGQWGHWAQPAKQRTGVKVPASSTAALLPVALSLAPKLSGSSGQAASSLHHPSFFTTRFLLAFIYFLAVRHYGRSIRARVEIP